MPTDNPPPTPQLSLHERPLRFIVFTCRDPKTDFRLPLVDALRSRGHEVHYIWLKRRPQVSGPRNSEPPSTMTLMDCFRYLRAATSLRSHINFYFTTTNLCFPALMLMLHAVCASGVWCFDIHDDLLYSLRGLSRLRARVSQTLLLRASDVLVHAAPTLKELFPRSHHLGNASAVGYLVREAAPIDRVLILASIDERMDFAFLDAVAALRPDFAFDVHGQISRNVQSLMRNLLASRSNVRYHGAYVNADLVPILQRNAVMLAPYRVDDRLTRYLDPLRYYHALNSGMEVITTGIPQAQTFASRLFIVRTPQDAALVLAAVRADPAARRNADGNSPITWDTRADQLVEILKSAS